MDFRTRTVSQSLMALMIAAIVLTAGTAGADHGWGILASYWGTSDASDGPGIGGKLSWELLPWVLWDMRGTWYEDLGEDPYELQVIPWETGVSFVGNSEGDFQYFAGLGGGYYVFDMNYVEQVGGATSLNPDNEVGLYGNAGIEYTVSRNVESIQAKRATLFLELMYRSVSVTQLNIGPTIAGDLSLDGPSVNFGFMLRW